MQNWQASHPEVFRRRLIRGAMAVAIAFLMAVTGVVTPVNASASVHHNGPEQPEMAWGDVSPGVNSFDISWYAPTDGPPVDTYVVEVVDRHLNLVVADYWVAHEEGSADGYFTTTVDGLSKSRRHRITVTPWSTPDGGATWFEGSPVTQYRMTLEIPNDTEAPYQPEVWWEEAVTDDSLTLFWSIPGRDSNNSAMVFDHRIDVIEAPEGFVGATQWPISRPPEASDTYFRPYANEVTFENVIPGDYTVSITAIDSARNYSDEKIVEFTVYDPDSAEHQMAIVDTIVFAYGRYAAQHMRTGEGDGFVLAGTGHNGTGQGYFSPSYNGTTSLAGVLVDAGFLPQWYDDLDWDRFLVYVCGEGWNKRIAVFTELPGVEPSQNDQNLAASSNCVQWPSTVAGKNYFQVSGDFFWVNYRFNEGLDGLGGRFR